MPVGQQTQLFRAELDVLTHAIQHHEVIAGAMHFGELYEHLNKSICRANPPARGRPVGSPLLLSDPPARSVAYSLIPRLSNLICLVVRTAPTSILPPKGRRRSFLPLWGKVRRRVGGSLRFIPK